MSFGFSLGVIEIFTHGAFGETKICQVENSFRYQAIPGNDQGASATNQKTAGSKLDRTSQLMFNLWLFKASGKLFRCFLVRICLLRCLLRYLVKSLVFKGTIFE